MKTLIALVSFFSLFSAQAVFYGKPFNQSEKQYLIGTYNGESGCSMNKIAPRLYLTAAHCLVDMQTHDQLNNALIIYRPDHTRINALAKIYYHPDVNVNDYVNNGSRLRVGSMLGHFSGIDPIVDIAIVEMTEDIDGTKAITIAKTLPQKHDQVELAGFGMDESHYPFYPRKAEQRVHKITKNFIVVKSSKEYPAHLAGGDSGSALVMDKQIVGVASWELALPFGLTKARSYYVRSDLFVDWATDVLNGRINPDWQR